jgi:hypothetical protein
MEFYLHLMDMFFRLGDALVSIFGRGKVVCAGMVCANLA